MNLSTGTLLTGKKYELVFRNDDSGRRSIALIRHEEIEDDPHADEVSLIYQVDAEDLYTLFDPMSIILHGLKDIQAFCTRRITTL